MHQARSASNSGPAIGDLINQPGTFLMIPVTELKTDTTYQRGLTGSRVDRIAENWSWIAFSVVVVALSGPGSGDFFIVDGQHRVAAAERKGIVEVPCIVFESQTHEDEAQGFLDTNTSRKAMSIMDRYRALITVHDPVALKVQQLLDQAHRNPYNRGGGNNDNSAAIMCLDYCMQAVSIDEDIFVRIWPLVVDLCEGRLIVKRLLQGLFYTERYLTNTSLLERHWRRRLLQCGYDVIIKSIDETCAYEGRSGAAICAAGVLRSINRGLRNKLYLTVEAKQDDSTE